MKSIAKTIEITKESCSTAINILLYNGSLNFESLNKDSDEGKETELRKR